MMPAYSHVASSVVLPKKVCRRLKLCEVSVAAMKVELRRLDFWRAVIGECLATLLYVLLGCSSTLACETHYANAAPSTSDAHYVVVALCFGLTSMALTYGFCHISDAHLNPVVSVAMTVTCRITPLRAAMYTLAQLGGAVAGAAILYGLVPSDWQSERGLVTLHENLSEGRGFGLEFLTTFLLVFLIFASGDPGRKEPSQRAVVIGLTITTCHLATYKFTRSAMNPARALGPAFVMNHWSHHWVYWAGPMAGGVLAGVLYEYIFDPSRGKKRTPATPSKRASMIDDPELLSVTYPSSVHTNRCTRDSYVSNGVPCDIYTSCPNTKTIYYPNIMAPYNNSGLENQAYSSDGRHQRSLRLIQDTAPPPPPPAPPESGEIILMEDVGNRIYNDRLR